MSMFNSRGSIDDMLNYIVDRDHPESAEGGPDAATLRSELTAANEQITTLREKLAPADVLKKIAELERRNELLVDVGHRHGWDGVANSKFLWSFFDETIATLREKLAEAEALVDKSIDSVMGDQRLTTLTERAEKAEAERKSLGHTCVALNTENLRMEARSDTLAAQAGKLREALEDAGKQLRAAQHIRQKTTRLGRAERMGYVLVPGTARFLDAIADACSVAAAKAEAALSTDAGSALAELTSLRKRQLEFVTEKLAALENQRKALDQSWAHFYELGDSVDARVAALLAELRELREDKSRLDAIIGKSWRIVRLSDHIGGPWHVWAPDFPCGINRVAVGDTPRAAIDAARRK